MLTSFGRANSLEVLRSEPVTSWEYVPLSMSCLVKCSNVYARCRNYEISNQSINTVLNEI